MEHDGLSRGSSDETGLLVVGKYLRQLVVLHRVAGRDEESARKILERRPLVKTDLLRKFSVTVEQTLIVFSRPPCGATAIHEATPFAVTCIRPHELLE
jgi:hypothetical protein